LENQVEIPTDPIVINVNGKPHTVLSDPDTALLYVLRNELGLHGPQFGCGLEQCGACMVLFGREAKQSCKIKLSEVGETPIITLEGLMEDGQLHPVQQAFIEEQAAQCGFCTNGMIISAVALLIRVHQPNDRLIWEALDGNLCRCGSHLRVMRAVHRAAELLWNPGA
jgi:nicotinate dehydrogenase subunit A